MRNVIGAIVIVAAFFAMCSLFLEPAPAADKGNEPARVSKLELVSPNGEHRILLEATNKGCGVWLSGPKESGTVAMYHGYAAGPTIGLYAPGPLPNALNVALGAGDQKTGGLVQIYRKGEPPRWLTFRDLEKLQDPERATKAKSSREYGPYNPASLHQPQGDDIIPAGD